MKVKAVASGEVVSVKLLIPHPMETGRRKDLGGNLVPAHFIKEVTASHKGDDVFHAEFGPGVSRDPFLSFEFEGGKVGDTLTISWIDNKGEREKSDFPIISI
ncbi:MAG: thiosulfate oxidation carrier complex protein SoxZ [Chlorobiaceae bacterium]|nr:thiosulfate oxidation carrier complex protein SoxZ [Chlorobiaceae bacterium]